MKKVTVFTGTRAEYGLLYWLMKDIQADAELELQLLVSGAHLSPEFGNTWQQIEADGFTIDEKVEMLLSSDTPVGTAKSIGLGVLGYADALARLKPDLLVLLGDRTEALAIAQTAMIMRIPICHLHGGEVTEGAYDDAIRHAISKLSHLHCTSTDEYRRRVIQLGENPGRVFNTGAIGLDHLKRSAFMNREELLTNLELQQDKPFLLVTYHPVTLAAEPAQETFNNLLQALDEFPEHSIILTYPNADDGGRQIIPLLEQYAAENPTRVLAIPSLGQKRYLSAVKHADAVIGNSSSGIIEVPSFDVPTVNIGMRQKGRLAAESVLHCSCERVSIGDAIRSAIALNHKLKAYPVSNPYGDGASSERILKLIKSVDLNPVKSFYDLDLESR